MRKILLLEFMTLDGVIQGPGGPEEDTSGGFTYGGWTAPYFDDFARKVMEEQMKQPFSLLLRRKTFKIWEEYWPQHADQWPGVNESTKYVVSNSISSSTWQNSIFLKGDIVEELKKIKTGQGPDLQVYGSANLAQTLLKNDLVDEMWLKIFPVTLGKGKRLFEDGTISAAFTLTESKVSPSGVILVKYQRAGEVKTGTVE